MSEGEFSPDASRMTSEFEKSGMHSEARNKNGQDEENKSQHKSNDELADGADALETQTNKIEGPSQNRMFDQSRVAFTHDRSKHSELVGHSIDQRTEQK